MHVDLDLPPDPEVLTAMGEGLVASNRVLMRAGSFPWLFDTRTVYRREPRVNGVRQDTWLLADDLLRRGYGDCEDLAAYMAAWLQTRGHRARFVVTRNPSGNFHARTWVEPWAGMRVEGVGVEGVDSGIILDPSRVLIEMERR